MFLGHRPRIYAENAADYSNNGLGFLPDAQTCKVTEKLNGGLELEMQYSISGAGYEHIKINAVIYTPINPYDNWQPFRVYSISRPQNGIVRVNAEHKAYELSGYPCLPNDNYIETPGSASNLMQYLQSEAARTATALGNPAYTFETDIVASVRWSIESPTDIWSVMADAARWFNGEWKYDGTVCRLCEARGQNRHVKVQYGSNLSTLTQDEVDTSYTHLMPYWTDGTTTVYVNGYYVACPVIESTTQKKVLVLDMTNSFDTQPTQQELDNAADAWIAENPPKGIEKNLKVTFVARGQTIEGASLGDIDHVELGDTIDVSSNPLNVNSTLRCITLVYDVLRGVYSNAELGVIKASLATATVTTTEKSDVTVWVSTSEPTEGYKSGDYWIKIDNNVTRIAQALGRYTGGNWLLLCEYGGGTGKFLDSGHTSVAHNDTENNTSAGLYDSVDGYKNTLTGTGSKSADAISNGCNTVTGQHNTVTTSTDCIVSGQYNTVVSCQRSEIYGSQGLYTSCYCILGVSNGGAKVNNAKRSILFGDIHGASSGVTSGEITDSCICVGGVTITVSQLYYSAIFGTGHIINDVNNYNGIFGNGHFFSGVVDSLIAGSSHTVVNGDGNTVSGQDNTVTNAGYSAAIGLGNTINGGSGRTVIGKYGEIGNNDDLMFAIGNGSSSVHSNIFSVDVDGDAYAKSYNTMGADYAEYFEWFDCNPDNEDRRGMLVNLDGDKIVPAHGNDFVGIISANPSVVGNNAEMHWHGKYKTDVFGQVLKDEAGKPIISDEYKKQQYIPRSKRSEWGLVGLVGRLVVTDDGSCKVGGYVSARRGIGTSCYCPTNARVLRRIDKNHIEVLLKCVEAVF